MRENFKEMSDLCLDAAGLNCPLPILKTKKILNTMSAGQSLEVIAHLMILKLFVRHLVIHYQVPTRMEKYTDFS